MLTPNTLSRISDYREKFPPLSRTRERELLACIYQNTSGDPVAAREELAAGKQYLIARLVAPYADLKPWSDNPFFDFDDLVQMGNLGLIRILNGYSPAKGKFDAALTVAVRNELNRTQRDLCSQKRFPPTGRVYPLEVTKPSGDTAYRSDIHENGNTILNPFDVAATHDLQDSVRKVVEGIPHRLQREVITLKGLQEESPTFEEVGRVLNFSRQRAQELHVQGEQYLRANQQLRRLYESMTG
ncbi:MAG: hypothetical protein KKA90_04530 [Nanoarchaeota archaeon]|nr:hypothetical protein [Nanoarchaeota archaeon]